MARTLALWALLSLLALAVLGAQSWNVEIIALSPEANELLDSVHQQTERWASRIIIDQERLSYLSRRAEEQAQRAYEDHRAQQWASHDLVATHAEYPTLPIATEVLPRSIAYTTVTHQGDRSALLTSTSEAQQWYRTRYNLDGLLLIDVQPLDRFSRVIVSVVEQAQTVLVDQLIEQRTYHHIEEALAIPLLGWAGANELAALVIEGGPPSLGVSLDGLSFDGRDAIIVEHGTHHLVMDSPSFKTRSLEVELFASTITTVDGTLEPLLYPDLTLISKSGELDWFVQGSAAGSSVTLSLANPTYPLTILATKEGFVHQTINIQAPMVKPIEVHMIGTPTLSIALMDRQQKAFYKQLRNTILFFGAHVATIALSQTAGLGSEVWQTAQVATSALALVNAIALGGQLASYGQAYGL